ncbi:MAG: T9SS type A sorting domain-containing protein [Chitinophagales bacterium]
MKTLHILFLTCLISSPLFAQWEPQNSGLTNNLRGIFFLNESIGFAVGEAFPPNFAPILKTLDGGATWVLKSSGTANPLRDIAFNNNVKGFACGLYGTLLKSNDMGDTWISVGLDFEINYRAIDFPSKDTGYVAGEQGKFLRTLNVGVSWDSLNTGISQDLLSIKFFNNDTGYASGSTGFSNGIIIRTFDAGATWQTVYTSSQAIPALAVTSDNTVFAGGGTSPNGGHEFIIRSKDGGDTWEEVYTGPPGFSIRHAAFNSDIAGWFVDDKGSVIRTKDGGVTWSVNNVSTTGLNSIFFTEEDTGYTVGGLGSIFKYIPCSIPLVPLGNITGETTVCNGATFTYSISPVNGAISYEWSVPEDASVVFIQGDTLITVTFGVASGTISVVAGADCDTSLAQLPVIVIPPLLSISTISGDSDFCHGATKTYYISPVLNALSYNWSVPPDANIIFQHDTLMVVSLGENSGIITVTASDNCDTISASIAVAVHFDLPPIGEIIGDTAICLGGLASYNVPAVPDAFSYDWTVPEDASIIFSQGDTLVVVQFDSTSGNVSVTANGFCDSVSTSFAVEVIGEFLPIDSIYGATAGCEGNSLSYFVTPVAGATDYVWTVPDDATIMSGQGDTLIVVSLGASSGEIKISTGTGDCNVAVASLFVTVTPLLNAPDDITGVTALCSGDTALYIVSTVEGADSYDWDVPAGTVILSIDGDTLITVIFGDNSGDVTFSASSICETITSSLYVMVHPGVPPIQPIVGPSSVCSGDTATFSVGSVVGVDYSWTVPFDATIVASEGDTSITVFFGTISDGISLVAGSACAFQDTFLAVTVLAGIPPIPPVTGPLFVCSGDTATYTINSVDGLEYDWTVPLDATIISSQGDTSITVLFGSSSGDISVFGNSVCALKDTSLSVNVVAYPPVPVISFVDSDLISSASSGNQWYYNASPIAGATNQIYTPAVNGTYSVSVTYAPGCTTFSDTIVVISVGVQESPSLVSTIVSPNPFESFTVLQFANGFTLHNSTLVIQDLQGKIVTTMNQLDGSSIKIFRNGMAAGVYFFRLSDEKNNIITTGKLIIQ